MRSSAYPFLFGLIVTVLLLCSAGIGLLIGWLTGTAGAIIFFAVPALAMVARALRCREPRPWLWPLFGITWAPLIWIALPVAILMISFRPEVSSPE